MKKADVKVGFLCNNKCLFCVQGDKRLTFRQKSFQVIDKELACASKDCKAVVFTGGEPTLHKGFFALLDSARSRGFQSIQIQTNGRLFCYEDFCSESVKNGATEFSIALHGHTSAIHDALTCAPKSFSQTVQGIKNLKKMGLRVSTNTVITKKNFKYLPAIADLLVVLGVEQFQFAFPHILGRAAENINRVIVPKRRVIRYVKRALDIGIKAKKKVMVEAIPYCFMKGYEAYVAERIIPETRVFDAGFVVEKYSHYRKTIGKTKRKDCLGCRYFTICEGPWREYPANFGWKEFKPVRETFARA